MADATIKLTKQTIKVTLRGAQGPRGLPSGPLGLGSVDADTITDDSVEQAAIVEKIGAASADDLAALADDVGTLAGAVAGLDPIDIVATAYTLTAADANRYLNFTAATAITITVPDDLPDVFSVAVARGGLGQPQFVAGSGAVIKSRGGHRKIEAQEDTVVLTRLATPGTYRLTGPLVA